MSGKGILLSVMMVLTAGAQDFTLENEFLKAKITPRGGKVISLYDKINGRELLTEEDGLFSGAAKMRDTLFGNLASVSGKYRLTDEGKEQVSAVFQIHGGNTNGMEIHRIYSLKPGSATLEIMETWKSREIKNDFALNWHNNFILPPSAKFYMPSSKGVICVDELAARKNKLNAVVEPAMPWLAAMSAETGQGTGIAVKNLRQVGNMFVWHGGGKSYTLEVNFHPLSLMPVAEADEWKFAGEIFPFSGKGEVLAVTPEAVLTSGAIYFKRSLGKVKITGDGKTVETEAVAGKKLLFVTGDKVTIVSGGTEYSINAQRPIPALKPATELPKRKSVEFAGFRYYYPELWLSDEVDTRITFALRGNFSSKKDFRLSLTLPPGVQLVKARHEILGKKKLPDGSTRYDLYSFRKAEYDMCIPVELRLDSSFRDNGLMLVQAVWDNGEQKAQQVTVKKIPPLPKPDKKLELLRIGLNLSYTDTMWPPPEFSKAGINAVKFQEYLVVTFIGQHKGEGFYDARLKTLGGLDYTFELWTPYPNVSNVLKGTFTDEAGRLFHPRSSQKINPDDLKAVDISGKKVDQICLSNHGRYREKISDMVKTAVDYGLLHLSYDEETWSSGATLCFCPRCKQLFKEFLAEKYPGVVYRDPAERNLSPELENAWWDFRTDLVAEIYAEIRKTLDNYRPEKKGKRMIDVWLDCSVTLAGRYPAITNRLTDYRKLARHVDYILPMCYNPDSALVGENARIASKLIAGTRAGIIMGLGPNRMYEYYRIESGNYADPDAPRRQILESVFNGAQGVTFWQQEIEQGAMLYYKIAQAVKMLLPLEEIIVKGQEVSLKTTNQDVAINACRLGNEYAVFLRNYDGGKITADLILPDGNAEITDTLTGEKCGNKITFDKERVKTLHIRRISK